MKTPETLACAPSPPGPLRPAVAPPPGGERHEALVRAYLRLSLIFLVPLGSLLGLWMLAGLAGLVPLGSWQAHRTAHGHLQVYGFVVLFTMGIALLVVPRLTGRAPQHPVLAWGALVATAAGTLLAAFGLALPGAVLKVAGVVLFAAALRARPGGLTVGPSARVTTHLLFTLSGTVWLALAAALSALRPGDPGPLELVLWGFATLYVMGVGLLAHPRIMSLPEPSLGLARGAALAWNLSLALRLAQLTLPAALAALTGAALFLAALRPFRRPGPGALAPAWLTAHIRFSYAWLVAVCLLEAAAAGFPSLQAPLRHGLAVGFLSTMMTGMAYRIVPAHLAAELPWPWLPWASLVLLQGGTGLRLAAQAASWKLAMLAGGAAQFVALLAFAAGLWRALLRCPVGPRDPLRSASRGRQRKD